VRACRPDKCSDWSEVRYVNVGRLFDDFNGDGYSDVIVGADRQDAGATHEGNAFVYYGSASGIPTTQSVTLDNPANQEWGNFGNSVASVFYDWGRKVLERFADLAGFFTDTKAFLPGNGARKRGRTHHTRPPSVRSYTSAT
jgi:hypothetical protein